MKGIYFTFIGASHSGKSTLLKYIAENFEVETKEVSARKLLDPTKGSYDEQMSDELESKIDYYYLQETFKNLREAEVEKKNIITSRCLIDSLAYTKSLKAAEFFIPLMEEAVEYIKDKIIILYTPCDFPMSESDDKLRGMNEKVRQETDKIFIDLIEQFDIPHYTISGSLEERKLKINSIMKEYHIKKKI